MSVVGSSGAGGGDFGGLVVQVLYKFSDGAALDGIDHALIGVDVSVVGNWWIGFVSIFVLVAFLGLVHRGLFQFRLALRGRRMLGVLTRFFVVFIPSCVIGVGGLWLGLKQSGFVCAVGWIVAALFGGAAGLQVITLVNGLVRIGRWRGGAEQRLEELEQRDADLFAQGKSFEEIMSQYGKKPKG